jgi:hypothetical protein
VGAAVDLAGYERRLRRAGLPTFVEDRTAREDVWTRAAPVLAIVLVSELVLAGNLDWPWWANALTLVGGVCGLTAAAAAVNVLRGRRALALPEDVGPVELVAFVLLGGLLQLLGGQAVSAAVVAGGNLALLGVLYASITFGVASILRFAVRRVGEQLATAVDLLARAIPLLLLFSVVLFVNTEMWQVFAGMDEPTLVASAGLLALVGATFLAVRLPREVRVVERDVLAGPPLDRRQRVNVGLVLFVSQALQALVVAVAIGTFFTAFGALAIGPEVVEGWLGRAADQVLALRALGVEARVSVELLRVSAGIAALSALYYSVSVLTDGTYRAEFLEELTDELRGAFSDRAAYLRLREAAGP